MVHWLAISCILLKQFWARENWTSRASLGTTTEGSDSCNDDNMVSKDFLYKLNAVFNNHLYKNHKRFFTLMSPFESNSKAWVIKCCRQVDDDVVVAVPSISLNQWLWRQGLDGEDRMLNRVVKSLIALKVDNNNDDPQWKFPNDLFIIIIL